MFGIAAVVLFLLAFVFHGVGFHGSAWIDPAGLLYAGLACLALHLFGAGAGVTVWRRTP